MRKILIIDDDATHRMALTDLYLEEGYEVKTVASGREGIDSTTTYKPDIILCDLMMPVMDGGEVINELHHRQETFSTPIILMTANLDPTLNANAIMQGATAFVKKPFNIDELVRITNTLVEKYSKPGLTGPA